MRRASLVILLLALAGCRLPEREGMNPLPENAPPLEYDEMLARARGQASSALDAYYVDGWLDLEQAAQRLEQSARLLPKSTHVPAALKPKLEAESDLLRQDSAKLLESARAKNATGANEAIQRITQRIRQLRSPGKSAEKE